MKYFTLAAFFILSSFISAQGQLPDLGILQRFVLFTSAGAVGNTGVSDITGDIGTDFGAITGFGSLTGTAYHEDATTEQGVIDVMSAYNQLVATPVTSINHPAAFGNGEIVYAGVYSIAGAASVTGTLTLDAQGEPNAVFIFKSGGAFTTAAATTLHLVNGASADNIFWIAEGAISMAASTTISGTFIAHNGAVDMGDGSFLEGRLLSINGAVSVYGTRAFIPLNSVLSDNRLSLMCNCEGPNTKLTWSSMHSNVSDITIQQSKDGLHWINLKTIYAGETSGIKFTFLFAEQSPDSSPAFYRLEQKSLTGEIKQGAMIRVVPCMVKVNPGLVISPNPSTGIFRLEFLSNVNDVYWTTVINIHGKTVYFSAGIPPRINLSNLSKGIYFVNIQSKSSHSGYTLVKL